MHVMNYLQSFKMHDDDPMTATPNSSGFLAWETGIGCWRYDFIEDRWERIDESELRLDENGALNGLYKLERPGDSDDISIDVLEADRTLVRRLSVPRWDDYALDAALGEARERRDDFARMSKPKIVHCAKQEDGRYVADISGMEGLIAVLHSPANDPEAHYGYIKWRRLRRDGNSQFIDTATTRSLRREGLAVFIGTRYEIGLERQLFQFSLQ